MADVFEVADCNATLADLPADGSLAVVITQKGRAINPIKLAKIAAGAREVTFGKPLDTWDGLKVLLDRPCASLDPETIMELVQEALQGAQPHTIWPAPPNYAVHDLSFAQAGDNCSRCHEPLVAKPSIEVGHTFLLGDKYSSALDATFARTNQSEQAQAPFEMGCYGIGISRLLGAVAEVTADDKGLSWPTAIAPYTTCIIPVKASHQEGATRTAAFANEYDFIIDDRTHLSFGARMKDAELVGYPATIVVGQHWEKEGKVEVHSRRSGAKTLSTLDDMQQVLQGILN